jgi:hypothetical protein
VSVLRKSFSSAIVINEYIQQNICNFCAKGEKKDEEDNHTAKMPLSPTVSLNNVYFQGRSGIISEKRIKFAVKEMRFKYVHDT